MTSIFDVAAYFPKLNGVTENIMLFPAVRAKANSIGNNLMLLEWKEFLFIKLLLMLRGTEGSYGYRSVACGTSESPIPL